MMPTAWIDRVWVGASFVLAGLAAGVVLWALLWDAWRTRRARRAGALKRCAGCWYDLSGAGAGAGAGVGARCPECGREAKGERGMLRARRRWRWAVLGLVLLAPAWLAWEMPIVRRDGWARMVPTVVLVCWPGDVREAMRDDVQGWPWEQLHARWGGELLGELSARILTHRLRRAWEATGEEVLEVDTEWYGKDAEERWYPRMMYCTGGGEPVPWITHPVRWQMRFHHDTAAVRSVVMSMISPYAAGDEAHGEGEIAAIENRLLIHGPAEFQRKVVECVALLRDNGGSGEPVERWEMTLLGPKLLEGLFEAEADPERLEGMMRRIRSAVTTGVRPGAWADDAGEEGHLFSVGDKLILLGTAPLRREAVEFIRELRRCGPAAPVVEWGTTTFVSLDGFRLPDREADWVADSDLRRIREGLVAMVFPEGWTDNGGEAASANAVARRMVVTGDAGVRRRSAEFLGAWRRTAADELPRRLGAFEPPKSGVPGAEPPPAEYVELWPSRALLRAWGAETDEELDARRTRNGWKPRPGRAEQPVYASDSMAAAFKRLAEARLSAWTSEDSDGDVRVRLLDGAVAVWTTRPDAIGEADGALREAGSGPGSGE